MSERQTLHRLYQGKKRIWGQTVTYCKVNVTLTDDVNLLEVHYKEASIDVEGILVWTCRL